MKEIPIKDEYIKLDQFLKFVNLVSSGIEAKMIIKDGQVKVNGEVELRRGKSFMMVTKLNLKEILLYKCASII